MHKIFLGSLIGFILIIVFGAFGYTTYIKNSPRADEIASDGSLTDGQGSCDSTQLRKDVHLCIYTGSPKVTVESRIIFDNGGGGGYGKGNGTSNSDGFASFDATWASGAEDSLPTFQIRSYREGCSPATSGQAMWKTVSEHVRPPSKKKPAVINGEQLVGCPTAAPSSNTELE